MTVSTVVDHNDYTGNGVTTSFPYTFRIFKKTDLAVSVVDLSENITLLVLDTDYTVTNAGGYNGGNVVLTAPLANGWQISIARELEPTQETDLRNQGKFFAEVHEDAFDKLTMLIQQAYSVFRLALRKPSSVANWYDALGNYIRNVRDPRDPQDAATKHYTDSLSAGNNSYTDSLFSRTLRTPEAIPSLPAKEFRKNKIVGMDSEGNPIMLLPESGSAADVLLYLASQNGASAIGTLGGVNIQQWFENDFIARWGGKPDYTGTPLYDGNDSTRITATDNSPMLQNALNGGVVRNGILHIYFPAGHYGFKTDGVSKVADSSVHTIIFHGAGIDETTLDFVYERPDTAGATVTPANASMLVRLTGFKKVIWSDLTAKCTTKSGPISLNPVTPDTPDVYCGAVWISHAQNCMEVIFNKVRSRRGNYRGFSTDAQPLALGNRTVCKMFDCQGLENTSTGFWFSYCNSLYVQGGLFTRNGTKGVIGTGYGIAASQYVDDVLVVGASFIENYRKGFDRHGGVGSLVMDSCTFADNLLWDVYDNKQYNLEYPSTKYNYNHFSGCHFYLNRNTAWLAEAVAAVSTSASCIKTFIGNKDRTIAEALANKQREASFSNCSFRVLGNVPDGYQAFNGFTLETILSIFDNCSIDTSGFRLADTVTGNVYSSLMFSTAHAGATIKFRNTIVKTHPGKIKNATANADSNSVLFTTQADTIIETNGGEFDLTNFVLCGATGGGDVFPSTCTRKFTDTIFKFRNIQLRTHSRTEPNGFNWINGQYGFKNATGAYGINNCKIGFGDCVNLSPLNGRGANGSFQRFTLPAQSKTSGSTGKILIGQVNSNIQIELNGALELASENFKATWRYSTWTKNLITSSPTVNIDRLGTLEAITFNGDATNFLAQPMTINWTANTSDTGWYNGTISSTESYLPYIISIQ
ncbi:TPA: hypothetical protein ACVG9H_001275 [Enterobacter hormaechei]